MQRMNGRLGALCLALLAAGAQAAPKLRYTADVRGDFTIIGNTMGYDCSVPLNTILVGAVNGSCGTFTDDNAPDVFWRADDPAPGMATADIATTPEQARTTAVLRLPAGATVKYARLYWAAEQDGFNPTINRQSVTLERPGLPPVTVTMKEDDKPAVSISDKYFYQSSAEITAQVKEWGPGPYRVTGVGSVPFANVYDLVGFATWSLVVVYNLPSSLTRNISIFDGRGTDSQSPTGDLVSPTTPISTVISGFKVPNAGFEAKLGVIAYEGDNQYKGDQILVNGTPLTNGQNPADNFFNSTHSDELGNAVSTAGDLPQLTGAPNSMGGLDIDTVDITPLLRQGDINAKIDCTTQDITDPDRYVLGALVMSVSIIKPVFTDTTKTYVDLNAGDVLPRNIIEYTITTHNTGSDTGVGVVLKDVLPAGLSFVPGSLQIVSGFNTGPLTDAAGDDQGEYDAATRTVRVRLGSGADATKGGDFPEAASPQSIRFRVSVNADALGTVSNQAIVTAQGQVGQTQGVPPVDFLSDATGTAAAQPTVFIVDACTTDADCGGLSPTCDTSVRPHVCRCVDNSQCANPLPYCAPVTRTCSVCVGDGSPSCLDPSRPACYTSGPLTGSCNQCSATNKRQCTGDTAACDTDHGVCVQCVTNSDCGGATPVCLLASHTCQPCSDTVAELMCPDPQQPVCQTSGELAGQCTAGTAGFVGGSGCRCQGARDGASAAAQGLLLLAGWAMLRALVRRMAAR